MSVHVTVDMYCLRKVRRRERGARFVDIKGRKYKLCWSRNNDEIGGVGILVKEELCEKTEVRRKRGRAMAVMLVFEEEIIRVI